MKPPTVAKNTFAKLLLCAGFTAASFAPAPAAVTWHDFQFGGNASQGYLVNNGHNDYLGKTNDGTFDFREYSVNASWAKGNWRIGAQAFGQKLGEYGDDKVKLDWATVDYQPIQWFGIRVGRVKTPRGLYNEALDLDSVRPFVLLPQSVYDNRLRDFNASFDGGMILGNVSLHNTGSLDYRAYYGDIAMQTDSGASDYFNQDAPYKNAYFQMDYTLGGSLFWNTPIDGLRLGYSFTRYVNFGAGRIIPPFPPFTFTSVIATRFTPRFDRHLVSAEYIHGDWTLAVEAGKDQGEYDVMLLAVIPMKQPFIARTGYVSVARRINKHIELGTYVSYSEESGPLVFGVVQPGGTVDSTIVRQTDVAVSIRYDINDRFLIKAEVHSMHGAGKIFDTADHPQPLANRDNNWAMLALKTTFTF